MPSSTNHSHELSIRFTADEAQPENPFHVSLFNLGSGNASPSQPFKPPLGEKELDDIRWYLEVFAVWPTDVDYERAREIEKRMKKWGQELLESVTLSREALQIWQQFYALKGKKLLTIDATDPRILRLPWELLVEQGGPVFSAGVSVRRRVMTTQISDVADLTTPVRVLVVVSRPDDAGFIPSRTITRPLLDAVDGLGKRVVVEFLPRPTLDALSERLHDPKASQVHVVHFDGHGVYDKFEGLGFLLFEDEKHKKNLVGAEDLGTLLNQTRVPLVVLNACQSAETGGDDPFSSVATRLLESGIGSVIAMNYSVLVVAAHKFVAAFYGGLADGLTVGQAMDAGRRKLLSDKKRHTITRPDADGVPVETTIELQDWFLPALYQQAADPILFPDGAPEPEAQVEIPVQQTYPGLVRGLINAYDAEGLQRLCYELGVNYDLLRGDTYGRKAQALVEGLEQTGRLPGLVARLQAERPHINWDSRLDPSAAARSLAPATVEAQSAPAVQVAPSLPAALPPPPRHGFHGRSREILALDRAFLSHRVIVLHGFGGLGKTALAVEAGRWFTRTGRFPGGAAFVSFEHGGSLDQLCSWVGQRVSGDPKFEVHGAGDMVTRVGDLLRERPALLVLDNFESVLGRAPEMAREELQAVLDAVWGWMDAAGSDPGGARVLITTRDTTFNDSRFAPSRACKHVPLSGLAAQDALELAAAVLDDHGIDRPPRAALETLLARLGGHPLSLNLVLPRLRDYTPEELTARFEALLPGFVTGAATERNESLQVSLEFSLDRLGEATRAALPDLAVFEGAAFEDDMLDITEMDAGLWQAARAELEQAALVTVEQIPGVNPPFLRFHPTLLPYLARRLDGDRRAALETRFWQRYYAVVRYLYREDTQSPYFARAIAQRELPNLKRGVALALQAGEVATAVAFADSVAKFLDHFGRWRERAALLRQVEAAAAGASGTGEDGPITRAEFLLQDRRGEALLQQGQAAAAEELFAALLARLEAGAAYGAEEHAYDVAMTHLSLGRCAAALGRPQDAIARHQQALAGFEALSATNQSAKVMLGRVYADLGDNLAALGRFDEAQTAYERSLAICEETEDQRTVGVAQAQLGNLALRRSDLSAAQERHREALATFRRLGEPQMEAVAWHQLGIVAQEGRQWAEAERCYREAMRIREQIRDLPLLATTYNQLALVAQRASRPDEAERWFLKAIALGEQLGDKSGLAKRYSNLASLYRQQGRLAEAEPFARRALAINETLDPGAAEIWTTYAIMAKIATANGDAAAARTWRHKEQEAFAAYAGAAYQLPSWAPQFIAAVVAAAQGNQQARAEVARILPQLAETNDWKALPPVVERILAGETDGDVLCVDLDCYDAYIIRQILAQLAGDAPAGDPTPPPAAPPDATAGTGEQQLSLEEFLDQLLQGVEAACRPDVPAALSAQMHALTQGVAQMPGAPPELQAFGRILNAILSGERRPDLSPLPPQLAAPVEALLQRV